MFSLFRYFMRNANQREFTGALLDSRPPEEKVDDIHFSEIVASANPVNWQERYPNNYRKFPELNQHSSNSCGANALSKALGTNLYARYGSYIQLSRFYIYKCRENAPTAGMSLPDMFKIASQGVPLEAITPSKGETDADYEKITIKPWMVKEGETWKVTKGIYVQPDMETIASIIQTTGKGVILLTWFLAGEWSKEVPYTVQKLGLNDPSSLRHFVTAVDYVLYLGKKYLVIEDSAWFGGINRRLVSEEWLRDRVYIAGYLMNFAFEGTQEKPSYDGSTIVSAQECLRAEGLFPSNISFVENIGPVTRAALINFQTRYALKTSGIIDFATGSKLHQLYP